MLPTLTGEAYFLQLCQALIKHVGSVELSALVVAYSILNLDLFLFFYTATASAEYATILNFVVFGWSLKRQSL